MQNTCPLCELKKPLVDGVHQIKSGKDMLTYPCANRPVCYKCGAGQSFDNWIACERCKTHRQGCQCFGCRFL